MVQDTRYQYNMDTPFWTPPEKPLSKPPLTMPITFTEPAPLVRTSPPQTIDKALKEQAGIHALAYFLVTVGSDGKPQTFASGVKTSLRMEDYCDVERLGQDFLKEQAGNGNKAQHHNMPRYMDGSLSRSDASMRGETGKRHGHPLVSHRGPYTKRARPDTTSRYLETEEPDSVIPAVKTKRRIPIGQSQEVWKHYEDRFKKCQQTACKLIAKAWVKAVEPKKQSTHPYTGSDNSAPDWWPKPYGPSSNDRVRHKEPDHLLKHERLHLLCHILRLIVEPTATQHPSIQKLNLNVDVLEEATNEALSSWFAAKEAPSNAMKKPFLKDIFKMARQEERFKRGEIDGTTCVYITTDDGPVFGSSSDPDEEGTTKDDDELPDPTPISSRGSPTRSFMPPNIETGSSNYIGQMPDENYDNNHYGQPLMGSTFPTGRVETPSVSNQGAAPHLASVGNHDLYPNSGVHSAHDTGNRRGPVYSQPTDFSSPAGLFPPTTSWQPAQTTAAPSQGIPTQYDSNAAMAANHNAFMNNQQMMMAPNYTFPPPDGLERPSYSASNPEPLRHSLPHPNNYAAGPHGSFGDADFYSHGGTLPSAYGNEYHRAPHIPTQIKS